MAWGMVEVKPDLPCGGLSLGQGLVFAWPFFALAWLWLGFVFALAWPWLCLGFGCGLAVALHWLCPCFALAGPWLVLGIGLALAWHLVVP
jgi:hypothetical protein